MQINVTFHGIVKAQDVRSDGITLFTPSPNYTTFLAVPVDLSMTVECLATALIEQIKATHFSQLRGFLPIIFNDGEFRESIIKAIELDMANSGDLVKQTLRERYTDSVFACSEPVALYEFKFTVPPIQVKLIDAVPVLL